MKNIIIILLLAIPVFVKAQQDPQYSQYMFNHVVINPAYAGSKNMLNATLLVRKQWVGVDGSPQTNSASVHGPIKSKKIGLGAHIIAEQIGPKKWGAAYGDFSYRIKLGNAHLSFGASAGMISYQYDFNKINYADASEITVNVNELNKNRTRFDANVGVYYYSNAMFAGYSMTHLNEPNLYDIVASSNASASALVFNLKRHHFFTLGRGFQLSEKLIFSPSLIVKSTGMKSGNTVDLNLNFLLNQKLWLGTSLRSSKTVVVLAQYSISNYFKAGYAFDFGFNRFSRNGGSHEVMLNYSFGKLNSHIISPRYL
ncbi:MAG: type IX secretion system membrane protein PorP/SprF [Bacteroidota bacterium]|nr:type IX secretion system membrane protein PorP/SprF [Bacteroidota bacterium]